MPFKLGQAYDQNKTEDKEMREGRRGTREGIRGTGVVRTGKGEGK